jgi:hypothetical protein
MSWFRKKPDNRPPSIAAIAAAKSLSTEPERWELTCNPSMLTHDSGVSIDVWEGWFNSPWTKNESEANEPLLRQAIDEWTAKMLMRPEKPLAKDGECGVSLGTSKP